MGLLFSFLAMGFNALAMESITGWTEVSTGRLVLDPLNTGAGEVREFVISGGDGSTDSLLMALQGADLPVSRAIPDTDGAVNLVFDGLLGRAKMQLMDDGAHWYVVLVNPDVAGGLDPDALLKAAMPMNVTVNWGEASPVTLSGAGDGSPWGVQVAVGAGWVSDVTVEPWAYDSEVHGSWVGSAMLGGAPTKLTFRFEGTGAVLVELKSDKATVVEEGGWTTRQGMMRLDLDGGGNTQYYDVMGSTLTLEYKHLKIVLHKK